MFKDVAASNSDFGGRGFIPNMSRGRLSGFEGSPVGAAVGPLQACLLLE